MNKFVFKKVAELTTEKTELSEVKVDLALIDDLQKASNLASKELVNATNASKQVLTALDDLKTAYRQSGIASNQVVEIYSTMSTQAKNLGIDLPANIKKMYEDATVNLKNSMAKVESIINIKKTI